MHYLKARRQIRAGVETVLGSAGLEPRLGRALFDAFDGREVEVAVYEGLARISPEEAESDLHAAAERGLLARRAAGRGFVAGPRLYAAVAEALSLPATGPVSREWIVSELARPQPAAVAADQ